MNNHSSFDIFVPGVGQHENIGDIILRRPLVNWLRESGRLHVYVGSSCEGYDKGLGIQPNDVVYYSFIKWYLAGLWHALRFNAHYVFKPGEIQLSFKGLKEHLVILPLLLLVRVTGGKVIRIGSGARNFSPLPRLLMRPSIWMANFVRWRDPKTTAYMNSGETMPDLAFSEGDEVGRHMPFESRDVLVLSMRGDRKLVSWEWLEAVQHYAELHTLKIYVVTQVLRDSELSKRIAVRLHAELLDWDGQNHDRQEVALRQLYARTHTVVSDRLHVLITAYTHGALPIGMLTYDSDKIQRHFDAIGVDDISVYSNRLSQSEILTAMRQIYDRRDNVLSAITSARDSLFSIKKEISSLLSKRV